MDSKNAVDEYFKNLPQDQKSGLSNVRKTVKELVPDAEEVMSYGMPAFKYNKRILMYYAAHTNNLSIYPASDAMIETVGKSLAKFRTSKGTLQFTKANPIPENLLRQIIKYRCMEIDNPNR